MSQTICRRSHSFISNARVEWLDREPPRGGRRVCASFQWWSARKFDKEGKSTMFRGWHSKRWDLVIRSDLIIDWLIDNSVFLNSFSDYHPSKQSLPFLPKSPKCLKPGQLAKVIAKTGRVVVGRIRYCGPVAEADTDETYVGLQLPNSLGDCDGSFGDKKFFDWWGFLIIFQRSLS